MYLKYIRAQGFKSFADKTEFKLKEGITGVVGPNGSGKSNVVDAVKWVLGEQSIKALRGSNNMSDVIFSGSKTRSAHTRASVSLVFDNEDHYLNSEFNELEIKRVVYKAGENEYFINNIKVRLKDITDLFIDSGAGKESFNIISQGTVIDVVNSKPNERRAIFEEAAGVLKYKKRKEESIRKLDRTTENLERVKLVIDELKSTVEPLKIQSENAKKFLTFKAELENIEIALIATDIERINIEYTKSKTELEDMLEKQSRLDINSTNDYSQLEKMKFDSLKLDEEITDMNSDMLLIIEELAQISSQKQLTSERKKYEVDDIKLQNNLIILKEDKMRINKNLDVLRKELEILEEEKSLKKIDYQNFMNELTDTQKRKDIESEIFETKYRDYMTLKNRVDILESNINNDSKLPYAVKSILNNPRLGSVHNILGKLIDTNEQYVTALETILGYNANVVIVDNENGAKECINYLKDNKLGRATFFPLNVIKSRYIDDDTLNKIRGHNGFINIASNLVDYNKTYDSVVKNQLGNVLIVDKMDSLNELGKLISYKYRIVSLDGDILHTGGSLTGGMSKNIGSILKDKFELEKLQENLNVLEIDLSRIKHRISDIKSNSDILLEKQRGFITFFNELEENIRRKNITFDDLKEQLNSKQEEIKGTDHVQKNSLDEELERILEAYYTKLSEKEKMEKDINKLKEKKSELSTNISELENIYRKGNSEYNKLLNDIKRVEVKLGKMDVNLDNLLLTLNENYSLTFEKAKMDYNLEFDESTARASVLNLKHSIRDLGEVNTGAVAEYERLSERYNFLTTQKNDLELSIESLLGIIEEMDAIMEDKFSETFDKIKIEFSSVFKKLFKGGEGILKLTDPNNILETGIDIIAEPPGKKLNSIALLSGGEKTLTAIALLFSILNVKPVPFCILDEVEAALDEANVDTFGNYLKELKSKSQFIVITHKKRTMEYTDVLYGITMQESGVSKLVSVSLEEIK